MPDDKVTMDDYLDGSGPEPVDSDMNVDDDRQPCAFKHCGRSFEDFGVRATKVRRKHERRCTEGDGDD